MVLFVANINHNMNMISCHNSMQRKKIFKEKKDEKMEDYLKHEIMEGVKEEDAKGQKKK
jgi:hypothetical protein